MVDFRSRIEAEYDAIEKTLALIPELPLSSLSKLEIAGVSTLIHNFYNGIENILKQAMFSKSIEINSGASWHQTLLQKAIQERIISNNLAENLKEYLAFRHFFSHSYALEINPIKLEPLIENMKIIYEKFKIEINRNIL